MYEHKIRYEPFILISSIQLFFQIYITNINKTGNNHSVRVNSINLM